MSSQTPPDMLDAPVAPLILRLAVPSMASMPAMLGTARRRISGATGASSISGGV